MTVLEQIEEFNPDAMLADGFETAIIGLAHSAARESVVAYDHDKCIQILMDRDGMDRETAQEFFDFNVVGAYVGPASPVFVEMLTDQEAE